MFDGPDGEDVGRVARRDDAADDRAAVRHLAEVARRRHDHDPRIDRALGRLAQRVVEIRLLDGMAERQVQHANVELIPMRHRPVDRVDHVARVGRCRPRRARAG